MGRLKTGTTPRLDSHTIDFSQLTPQYGDAPPIPFPSKRKDRNGAGPMPYHLYESNNHEIIKRVLTDPLSTAESLRE